MQEYRLIPSKAEYYRKYYIEHGDEIRQRSCDGSRQKLYGITPEQFSAMKERQNNLCFICGNPPQEGKSLGVDHNHTTGEIRVLLCVGCNWLAGRMESLGWDKLRAYLESYIIPEQHFTDLRVVKEKNEESKAEARREARFIHN